MTRSLLPLFAALPCLALWGCPDETPVDSGDTGGVACTEEALASVQATVADEGGGLVEADDLAVTYSVDGGASSACETWEPGVYYCGWEERGDFVVRAEATGYAPAEATVTVGESADGCHVVTEQVALELEALDGVE